MTPEQRSGAATVTDEYARFARWYDLLLNPLLDSLRQKLGVLCRDSAAGGTVLDICCGTGRQGVFLEREGVRAYGADSSQAMLQAARWATVRDFSLLRASGTHLPFADNTFAVSLICLALHEQPLPVARQILDEGLRVAPVCLVADYTMAERNLELPGQWLMQVPERLVGGDHWRHYRGFMAAGGTQGLLQRSGVPATRVLRWAGGGIGVFRCTRNGL